MGQETSKLDASTEITKEVFTSNFNAGVSKTCVVKFRNYVQFGVAYINEEINADIVYVRIDFASDSVIGQYHICKKEHVQQVPYHIFGVYETAAHALYMVYSKKALFYPTKSDERLKKMLLYNMPLKHRQFRSNVTHVFCAQYKRRALEDELLLVCADAFKEVVSDVMERVPTYAVATSTVEVVNNNDDGDDNDDDDDTNLSQEKEMTEKSADDTQNKSISVHGSSSNGVVSNEAFEVSEDNDKDDEYSSSASLGERVCEDPRKSNVNNTSKSSGMWGCGRKNDDNEL